jgi:hypothetical protein
VPVLLVPPSLGAVLLLHAATLAASASVRPTVIPRTRIIVTPIEV